jgi:hypothetical protein
MTREFCRAYLSTPKHNTDKTTYIISPRDAPQADQIIGAGPTI